MLGAIGEYLSNPYDVDIGTLTAIHLATFVGGITATGSMVAFGKLSNFLSVCCFTLSPKCTCFVPLL